MLRKLTLISRICGEQKNGGERGIRTPDTQKGITVFETAAFGHSAISPDYPHKMAQKKIFSSPADHFLENLRDIFKICFAFNSVLHVHIVCPEWNQENDPVDIYSRTLHADNGFYRLAPLRAEDIE